jgi:thioredoxin-like negative regulator of GroEL
LALVLATKVFDLPPHKWREFLSRAASAALTKEERWLAEIELARCLLASGKRDEALRILTSVKSESAGINPCALSDALSLQWEITGEEEDFRAAKSEVEKLVDSEQWQKRLAIILIDHGDLDEGERLLSKYLEARDPEAQLLAIDARLRAGRVYAAHELLRDIARERVTSRLQYPFAYTCALVALARDDAELKRLAAFDLRRLQIAGTQAAKHVQNVIEALESSDSSLRKSFVSSIRGLLAR